MDGFDMIAVEKKPMLIESTDADASVDIVPNKQFNRQGGDLKDDYDFIKVPKIEKQQRSDSPPSGL